MCKEFYFHRRQKLSYALTCILLLERVTYMAAEELVHFTKVLFHKINLYFQDLGRILGVCRWNDLGQRIVIEIRTPHVARSDK